MRLRREAADARILVVNHHLLLADLAARQKGAGYGNTVVLPPYKRVVIDEAHTIETAATSFFSQSFSRLGLFRQLGRLHRQVRARRTGLIYRLPLLASSRLESALERINRTRLSAEALDEIALSFCGSEGVFRLVPARKRDLGTHLVPRFAELREALAALTGVLREMLEDCGKSADDDADGEDAAAEEDPAVWELKAVIKRLEEVGTICASFVEWEDHGTEVLWLEAHSPRSGSAPGRSAQKGEGAGSLGAKSAVPALSDSAAPIETRWRAPIRHPVTARGGSAPKAVPALSEYTTPTEAHWWVVFTITPVDIAPALSEALFQASETVVCLSATLTVNNSFAYWLSRSGLSLAEKQGEKPLLSGIFPSPFPYATDTLLAIPADAPLPEEGGYQNFVNTAVLHLVREAGGSALVLFTSYDSLKKAWDAAAEELEGEGIHCLKQGDDDRSRLLARFLRDRTSVLFATDSFWEGVDAPGDTLSLVILCRLPFRTPRDPVFEARREAVQARGGNPFMDLSLPDSVMKFRQGFGRLMRRSTDRGVVAVLDGRVLRKQYGRYFIASLPETRQSFKDFDRLAEDVAEFLMGGLRGPPSPPTAGHALHP
jgi:Rad3-related DNA helicase